MKKKVISALLASTMIVSLVACGSTGGDSSDASSKGSGTTATSTAGGDDAATAESGSGSGDSAASLTGSNLLHWKMTLYLEKMTTEHSRNSIMS